MKSEAALEEGQGSSAATAAAAAAPTTAKKNSASNNKSKMWIFIILAVIGVIGLAVGLGLKMNKNGVVGGGGEVQAPAPTPTGDGDGSSPTNNNSDDSDGDDTTTSTLDGTPTLPSTSGVYASARSAALDVTLPLLSQESLTTYNELEDLVDDLEEVAKFFLNQVIEEQINYWGRDVFISGERPQASMEDNADFITTTSEEAAPAPTADDSSAGVAESEAGTSAGGIDDGAFQGVDDFDTNNQEEEVDEADVVKATEKFVFLAYGDILAVYEAREGQWITNVTMPEIEVPDHVGDDIIKPPLPPIVIQPEIEEEEWPIEEEEEWEPEPEIQDEPIAVVATEERSSVIYGRWKPKPRIEGIMVSDDKLVVVVGGYQSNNYYWGFPEGGTTTSEGETNPILSLADNTKIRVYDMSTLETDGDLDFLHETSLDGYYRDGRVIDDKVHVMMAQEMQLWKLSEPLYRWRKEFSQLSDEDYKQKAREIALGLLPEYRQQLMNEFEDKFEGTSNIMRISLWETQTVEGLEAEISQHGAMIQSFHQIVSFDPSNVGDDELELSYSGAFTPSGYGPWYATADMAVLSLTSWDWNRRLSGFAETTFLCGFRLGETVVPAALGALPGSVLDKQSIDIHDGYLRVATTIRNFMPWVLEADIDIVEDEADEEAEVMPPPPPEEQSMTENQIIILKIPDVTGTDRAVFNEVSRVEDLGLKDEVFTTVKMFDNVAYAVTFLRTDPFYVIDLDPADPKVLGELKVTGFSDQLLSFNDDNTKLVAIGQEADEDGRVSGFTVSLFDATVPEDPQLLFREQVEDSDDQWSFSDGAWDVKALRLVKLAEEEGILIVPLTIYGTDRGSNFDGFVVYDISNDGISERLRVSHAQEFNGCYYRANLPSRSLVFDGDVTTIKGHSIISTDLVTKREEWRLDAYAPPPGSDECVGWFF